MANKPKRKRGRPKKKPREIPKFETDKEIREAHNLEKMYINGAFRE